MSFKINSFPKLEGEQINNSFFEWLSDFFNRQSASDQAQVFIKDLPVWNMDTTASITIDLGTIPFKRIFHIGLIIFKDDELFSYDPSLIEDSISPVEVDFAAKLIRITRVTSGFFDTTDYDSTTKSRGRVAIWT